MAALHAPGRMNPAPLGADGANYMGSDRQPPASPPALPPLPFSPAGNYNGYNTHRRKPSNESIPPTIPISPASSVRNKSSTVYEDSESNRGEGGGMVPAKAASQFRFHDHRPRDIQAPSPDRFLNPDEDDNDQPLFSPALSQRYITHPAPPVQAPQMAIISSGDSHRSSRASSNFGGEEGRDTPVSRHSSQESTSSRKGFPQLQYPHQQIENNSPYERNASPASSQEGISSSRHLQAPGNPYRRSPRPSSVYSSTSDLRGRTPSAGYLHGHARAVSAHSYDSRRSSYSDIRNMQPPPPPLHVNNHLRGVVGSNASLLHPKQTLEMYRANAKKTNDPNLQYELAVFMIQAALQQETQPRSPTRDLDSPYVDNSAATSKADLLKEAKQLLESLQNKLPEAQYYLADAYASGLFNNGKPENEKAFSLFIAALKHGHAEAGYRGALCYEFGWGCRKDPAKAVQFYRQSASKNHPGAMTRLGKACLRGELGLKGHHKEGIKWLKRATDVADLQYPNAPYELGLLHENGYGDDVFQDLGYAAQLYTKAAELGHAEASYRMGDAYEHGKLNCPRDAALSVHFYTGAAQSGHPLAMMALCAWYMVGAEPVLERNEDEAYQWSLKAAETGLAKAEYAVGYFTEMGIGCRRDPLEANVWYVKAADHGDKRAKERLALIQASATADGDKKKKGRRLDKKSPQDEKECIVM